MLRVAGASTMTLREAQGADYPAILALLTASGLPTEDIASARPFFFVACDASAVVGVGAIQPFGKSALLRSVAVSPAIRGTGAGAALLRRLEQHATALGVTEIGLLTQTAKAFFEKHGYEVIERDQVPMLHASEEFRTLCPASAVCMRKRLKHAHHE